MATLRGSSRVGITTFQASLVTGSTTLIVPWPAGGSTDRHLRTLAEITGAKLADHKLDGISQLPLLLDENAKPPRDTYTYFYGDELIAQRRGAEGGRLAEDRGGRPYGQRRYAAGEREAVG